MHRLPSPFSRQSPPSPVKGSPAARPGFGFMGRTGLILLSILLLGGLWLLILWQISASRTDSIANAERDVANLTRAFSQHVSRTIGQVQQLVAEAADRVQSGYPVHLSAMRARVDGLESAASFLGVIDPQGVVLASTAPDMIGRNVAQSGYFRQATAISDWSVGIGKPVDDPIAQKPVVPFWSKAVGPDGETIAYVVCLVPSDYFTSLFVSLDFAPSGVATLAELDGTIYARMGGQEHNNIGSTYTGLAMALAARGGLRGVMRGASPVDGVELIAGYELLSNTRLVVGIGRYLNHVLYNHDRLRNRMVMLGGLGSALALALLGLVLRSIKSLSISEASAKIARDEAEQAAAAKAKFLAVASHELRTPLNAIIGFADIVSAQIHGPLHPKYLEYVQDIGASGMHLLALINDILDLSKIEAGRMDLSLQQLDPALLIRECARILDVKLRQGDISFTAPPAAVDCLIFADRLKLKQIMLNLIGNSIKYTGPGGHIRIEIAPRSTRLEDGIAITITDSGCGMNEAELAIAMEPFGQVHSHLSRSSEGTGLGLPVARALVELHGGLLLIASQPGLGTSAIVHLPRRPQSRQRPLE
jgi:two-component system, cell cycle sensor histidine kinase PleC